jgi:hypothetical protein
MSYHPGVVMQETYLPANFTAGIPSLQAYELVRQAFDLEERATSAPGKPDRYLLDTAVDLFHAALERANGDAGPSVQAAYGLGRVQLRLGHRWRAIRALRLAEHFGQEPGVGYAYPKRTEKLLNEVLADRRMGRRILHDGYNIEL